MLVDLGTARAGSPAPSLLNSPTLARVERARMKQEGGDTSSLISNSTLLQSRIDSYCQPAIKRGLLWQQRDRLFSRWKERYFVLTRDYLHCFKRASGSPSEMGQFIFKVKLVEVSAVQWINRRSYSTIALLLDQGSTGTIKPAILLRGASGLEDWFEILEECMESSKARRRALRAMPDTQSVTGLPGLPGTATSGPEWISSLQRRPHLGVLHAASLQRERTNSELPWPSSRIQHLLPHLQRCRQREERHSAEPSYEGEDNWRTYQRLSLLTDIDFNEFRPQQTPPQKYPGTPPRTPKSAPPGPGPGFHRHSDDVFFVATDRSKTRQQTTPFPITPSPSTTLGRHRENSGDHTSWKLMDNNRGGYPMDHH